MPARQGFEYSPEAAREGIGYGAAQVVDSGVGKMIDADVKRRQLELAEQAEKRKAAEDKAERAEKNKAPILPTGKLVPALQDVWKRSAKEFYEDYPNWDTETRQQKTFEMKQLLEGFKATSDLAFSKNDAYDSSKLTFNEDGLERAFDFNLFEEVPLDQIDMVGFIKGIQDYRQNTAHNFADEALPKLQANLRYNHETGDYERKEGDEWITTKSNVVGKEDAARAIEEYIVQDPDWIANAEYHSKQEGTYDKYKDDLKQYYVDKYTDDLVKNWHSKKITPVSDDSSGYNANKDVVIGDRPISISTPVRQQDVATFGWGIFGDPKEEAATAGYGESTSYAVWSPPTATNFLLTSGANLKPLHIEKDATWETTTKELDKLFKETPGGLNVKLEGVHVLNTYGEGTKGRTNKDINLSGNIADDFFLKPTDEVVKSYKDGSDADKKWVESTKKGIKKEPIAMLAITGPGGKKRMFYVPLSQIEDKVFGKRYPKGYKEDVIKRLMDASNTQGQQGTTEDQKEGASKPSFVEWKKSNPNGTFAEWNKL